MSDDNQVTEETVVVKQINVPTQNQEVKTQIGAFGAPTPKWAKSAFNILLWVLGVVTFSLNTLSWLDASTKSHLNEIVLIAIFAAKTAEQSLGLVPKE